MSVVEHNQARQAMDGAKVEDSAISDRQKRLILLQVNDALFPIGGWAHSWGLETYIQKGRVTTAEEAGQFIRKRLLYAFCYGELLSVRLAWECAAAGDVAHLGELEDTLEASRSPREVREAAAKMGSRFVKTVLQLDLSYERGAFVRYTEARCGKAMTHQVAYGAFCSSLGIAKEAALEHYLYAQTSALVTCCVKSVPLSQSAGQCLLCSLHPVFAQVMDRVEAASEADLCRSTPGFDIRCMQHEGLYSRIYMS